MHDRFMGVLGWTELDWVSGGCLVWLRRSSVFILAGGMSGSVNHLRDELSRIAQRASRVEQMATTVVVVLARGASWAGA